MPSESPISRRIVVISFSDFLPKFLVLSSSDSVFCTRSPMVTMLAVLRQLEDRTDRSSSVTLSNRCSLTALHTGGSAASPLSAGGLGAAWPPRRRRAPAALHDAGVPSRRGATTQSSRSGGGARRGGGTRGVQRRARRHQLCYGVAGPPPAPFP